MRVSPLEASVPPKEIDWKDVFGWFSLWAFLSIPMTVSLLGAVAVVENKHVPNHPVLPWMAVLLIVELGVWVSSLVGLWSANGFPGPDV